MSATGSSAHPTSRWSGHLPRIAGANVGYLMALAAVFTAASLGSIRVAQHTNGIAAIWLTNGLVLATLFKAPQRQWTAIMLVALAANLAADLVGGYRLADGAALSLIDLVEVFIVAIPMRRLELDQDIRHVRSLVTFLGLAFGPAIAASAALYAAYMHVAHGEAFRQSALVWYMADALGLIQVAPAALLVKRDDLATLFHRSQLLPAFSSLIVLLLVFMALSTWQEVPLGFLLFPCALMLAFQQSYAGVAFGMALTTVAVITNLFLNRGFIAVDPIPLHEKVFFMQFYIIVLTSTMLVVTSILFEKRKAEQRLREVTQAAIEARNEAHHARLEADKANLAKSQFLANMSHELRTPLNAILGFSEIIRGGGLGTKCTAKCPEHADYIHSAGSHLLDLVNDILDASKIEAGKFELRLERLNMADVVRDAMALVEHRAGESGVELRIDEPRSGLWLQADHRAMKQIVLNLLSNAVKFTPSGGSVTVALRGDETGTSVEVKDTGVGIPASELPRLGQPFERVRNQATHAQPGTGLGLALVRSLAELHGGTMTIESAEGIGTAVTVRFPASKESLAA